MMMRRPRKKTRTRLDGNLDKEKKMADFTNGFWNFYVMVLVAFGILLCVFILVGNNKRQTGPVELQEHVWDETLREYNNPLPRWWLYLFWITLIFSIVYLVLYPGFGNFPGIRGWTSIGQYTEEVDKVNAETAPLYQRFRQMDIRAVAADPEARAMGQRLFLTYCSQCHGSDAHGANGFPNLTDTAWHWGGEPETIQTTITGGRLGVMTPFKDALSADQIRDVVSYVRSLNVAGLSYDEQRAQRGAEIFQINCMVCHGPDAKGTPMLGAPDLTDDAWLWGSTENAMIYQVTNGRTNRMPGFGDFLGPDKVHLLAAYVWGLSNVPR